MTIANTESSRTRMHKLRVRFIGFILLALTVAGHAHAQFTLPTFDLSDIPGIDSFSDSEYLNCLTEPDPTLCVTNLHRGGATAPTGEDQAVLSLIESDYGLGSLGLPPAFEAFFLTALSTPPAIHLAHKTEYENCANVALETNTPFADCGHTWTTHFPSIAAPQDNFDRYDDAVDQIWRTFRNNVIDDIHRALNNGVSCLNPPRVVCSLIWLIGPQVPVVDPLCVTAKLLVAWPEAFIKHYPQMWADIGEATLMHLPNTVAFGLDFTNPLDPLRDGSLVAPIADVSIANLLEADNLLSNLGIPLSITDLTNPGAIAGLDSNARENLYYHEALIARLTGVVMNTPVLPGENNPHTLGIDEFEANKRALETNTGLMYETIGYAMFSQLTAPQVNELFSSVSLTRLPFVKPSLEIKCLEGGIPTGVAIPIPVVQRVARPEVKLISVAEGHVIPNTAGDMLSLY